MFNEIKRKAVVPVQKGSKNWKQRHPVLKNTLSNTAKTTAATAYAMAGAHYVIASGSGSNKGKALRGAVAVGAPVAGVLAYKGVKKRNGKRKR